MAMDTVGVGDGKYGTSKELKLPPVEAVESTNVGGRHRVLRANGAPDFSNPAPYAQGPRRMGTDKNDDVLYVGNSWAGTLAKIDTRTGETSTIPLPAMRKPYQVAVDSRPQCLAQHLDDRPGAALRPEGQRLHGLRHSDPRSEARYVSLYEKDGQSKVVLPSYRTRKVSGDDAAQRGRHRGGQGASGAVTRHAGAR